MKTVGEGSFAAGGIRLSVGRVVGHLGMQRVVLHGAASLRTLADFPFEVKGMNALAAQQLALIERTAAEVCKVLLFRAVPAYFSNGQHARVKHILSVFRRRHIFCP